MKKHMTFKEQSFFVKNHPEKVKEYQEFLDSDFEMGDTLCPSAEEAYHKIKESRPSLPDICYVWHSEYNKPKNDDEMLDIDVI